MEQLSLCSQLLLLPLGARVSMASDEIFPKTVKFGGYSLPLKWETNVTQGQGGLRYTPCVGWWGGVWGGF